MASSELDDDQTAAAAAAAAAATTITLSECAVDAVDMEELWMNFNETVWNGSRRLQLQYSCRLAEYAAVKAGCEQVEAYLDVVLSLLGFLGGLLTVATLLQRRFRNLDFRLFRLIGWLEMVQTGVGMQMAVLALTDGVAQFRCDASYLCTFVWMYIGVTIMNICSDAADMLILFLCVERVAACLLAYHFQTLHNRSCHRKVVVLSLIVPTLFSLVQAFELRIVYDENQGRYADKRTDFASTVFYGYLMQINTGRFYALAGLISAGTVLSMFGLWSVRRRRRKLLGNVNAPVLDGEQQQPLALSVGAKLSKAKKQEIELCCLQLCLAVPVVINHVLYATTLNTNDDFNLAESALEKGLDYDEAVLEIDRAETFHYLQTATNVTNVLAHSLHFYLYLLFSVKLRQGFISLMACLRRRRPHSSPSALDTRTALSSA